MKKSVLQALEFHKIIEQLTSHAETSLGKEKATALIPSNDLEKVVHMQEETDETVQIIRLNQTIPLGGIKDIRASLSRSVIGGVLSASECLDVANTIYGSRQVKSFIEGLEDDYPLLEELSARMVSLRELEQFIKMRIDDHGYVMDSATEKLRGIRSSMKSIESKIRDKMENYIRTNSSLLSDAIVTIRNDRYVLPVKQEHRSTIGGIVHDQSSSGQTLFMEPRAIVDLNNRLHEASLNESREIERILTEISAKIAEEEAVLQENIAVLAHLDFIYARAKLAAEMNAAKPEMNDKGIIKMKQARHPLIPQEEVVPNDIELGESFTSIVITGPNTGGKTVTLKMVGLCTLMAQSGLQVPALDGCKLAVFHDVFADIGDEQSIEQNLSTFSSHMTNIVHIMKQVDQKSLVLFDELGSGTDPQEGAALAMSLLDEVVSRNARVIATTHYPELKAYGYNRKQVVNASVEFDVDTLRPTYRLLLGVPGRSNAFEISKRLGLDLSIIENAKGFMAKDTEKVDSMIASLEESQIGAEKDYEQAHEILNEAEQLYQTIESKWNEFLNQRETLFKKAEEKAEKAIKNAREEAEIIVEELRNMKSETKLKEHEWIEAKKMLEEAQPELTKSRAEQSKPLSKNKGELKPGDEVKLISMNQKGEVLEKVTDREYLVQVGIMKVKVKRNELEKRGKRKKEDTTPIATVKGSNYHVKPELDLRGERFEDALHRLEHYIDDALLAGYSNVSIIHGKGTGALRKGVQEFSRKHSRIASYRAGSSGEGGSGVTVIELK
jgi:DNA mismatch repair protein MutS2